VPNAHSQPPCYPSVPEHPLLTTNFHAIPLFSELDASELEEILSFSILKEAARDARIFSEDDPYTGFFVVLRGSVKVFKEARDGKELILHLLRPLSLLAEVPLFDGGNYPANAEAMEETELLYIDKNRFIECLDATPQLMRKMLIGLAKKVRVLSEQLESLTLHDVTCRLARFLVSEIAKVHREELAEPFLSLKLQWSVIAAQLGTARETLSRSLKRLQSSKIIKLNGHSLIVLDYQKLREIAQQ